MIKAALITVSTSRDLDEDPSESISPSHQHKLQKDLGEFFDKQTKEGAAQAEEF